MGKTADVEEIVKELKRSYEMEIETVINYLANSIHLDGILAMEVRESLGADIQEELGHARQLAERIKVLDFPIPGSLDLTFSQKAMQPPAETTDVLAVIKGVIEAEEGAIKQYKKIVALAGDADPITHDLAVGLMADEEKHRREFIGFLRDFESRPSLRRK